MKIVEINYGYKGSTGNIMLNIAKLVREQGDEAYTFSCVRKEGSPELHNYFGSKKENILHRIISVSTGISGTGSVLGTKKLIEEIKKISPDILHLHNLHGWYINLPILFDFIRKNKIKTVWTLHDCWGFTAQCSHFTIEKCYKWKTGCYDCPRYRLYPYTFVDQTKKMWSLKKEWFSKIDDLTIVTPSKWLAELAKQSFLKEYPVKVINNGVDLSIFKPQKNEIRKKFKISDEKHIVLGVASGWGYRKGIDVFVELSKTLDKDKYQIIVVGTDNKIDTQLPDNIISIHRTNNQMELAEIYTEADVFVNPTREEVLGLVNLEANACGTPVITFDTGGSPECINQNSGLVIPCDDIVAMRKGIENICVNKIFSKEDCIDNANKFDINIKYKEYINLYEEKCCKGKDVI